MSQIAVIGLGRFGSHVARGLHDLGHEVLAIDIDPAPVQRLRDHSTQAVVLDAREEEALRGLGVAEFDTVVLSLGARADASALVALHVKDLGVGRLVVKAMSEDHARVLQLIGADDVIFPERDAAERVVRRLSDVNLIDVLPLGEGYSVREVVAAKSFAGKSLAELRLRNRFGVQVVAIRHPGGRGLTVNPGPDLKIREADTLLVLGANKDLDRLKAE
jgi:trk system potassium uptake protein TrkA